MKADDLFMTDAQLASEVARCEFCEEKPCREACPAHCSPADFIMAIRQGAPEDFARSAALILTKNPLGGVCGVVCPDYHCQKACVHRGFDRPVDIPTIQAAIVARAKKLGKMPSLVESPANGHRVAVVGAGPAGIAAALLLAQHGCEVELFEAADRAGGSAALIPAHRMHRSVLESDIAWALANARIKLTTGVTIQEPSSLRAQGFDAVVVACGLHKPIPLGIPGEELAMTGNAFLRDPPGQMQGRVAVIGGGAIACDCAVQARLSGAAAVEMFALESLGELPITSKERQLLVDYGIEVSGRSRVLEVLSNGSTIKGLKVCKVDLPPGKSFHPAAVVDMAGTQQVRPGFDHVIIAIGNQSTLPVEEKEGVFYAGDMVTGPSTVVEAVASGKNAAAQVMAFLSRRPVLKHDRPRKSTIQIPGWTSLPVPLDCKFFGRPIISPFLLSAGPPSDGYDQMKKAYEAGWAGGVMKTAFDGVPVHIPADYMHVFDCSTYGNCDNVSGHPLDRVCREVERLIKEYPDRFTAASTGGPVTGNDEADRARWVSNVRKLENAGAMAIELSLSCPQGGDGTEGDIVSQNAALTAKIVDWVMAEGAADVPKLFKLTAAVTSIIPIIRAIQRVLARYPGKKAGVTLANTFPTLAFRPRVKGRGRWEEAVLVGMSGEGIAPISYLTLATVAGLGITVSGNGGAMNYKSAANFLALGARTVQFCTVVMKYGVGIIDELHSGLSHLMRARGITSVEQLIGYALPDPVTPFMALTPTKRISSVNKDLCLSCGNCTRCAYLAVSLDDEKHPVIDPSRCIGCSLCTQKCFAGALSMRDRTPEELAALVES